MKTDNPKFTLIVIKVYPILSDYYENGILLKNFTRNSKQKFHENSLGYIRTDRHTWQSWKSFQQLVGKNSETRS